MDKTFIARIKAATANNKCLFEDAWEHLCQANQAFRRFACTVTGGNGRTKTGRFIDMLEAGAYESAALMMVPRGWIVKIVRDFNGDGEYVARVILTDSFSVDRGCDPEDEVSVRSSLGKMSDGDDPTARALCIACLLAHQIKAGEASR